jgi:hypothetical protein
MRAIWLPILAVLVAISARCFADDAVQARSADELVDSIGVNTHFGYNGTPYTKQFDKVAVKLGELGIRHIRDGADGRKDVADRIRHLHETYGIRVIQIVGPRVPSPRPWTGKLDPAAIDSILSIIKKDYGDANEAIEGPNEYDNTYKTDSAAAVDPDWPNTLKTYTQALYEKVKADPELKDRPVIGPSMAHAANAAKVPDLSAWMTFGNMHPYPGGWNPSRQLDDYNLPKTRHITGDRVIWATESGYQNAIAKPPGGHNPAPEAVSGKYGPRLVAEYFRRGIGRAYFYEFLNQRVDDTDQEACFGLLHNDITPKPIYTSLKAMIDLLKDPGAAFTPGKLAYTITPVIPDLRQLLLQKRDGRFYLLLWQEVPCYDAVKRTAMPVAARGVTLHLAGNVAAVNTYLPGVSGTNIVSAFDHKTTVPLPVSDDLQIVEIAATAN